MLLIKKFMKILATVVAIVIIGGILFFANAFLGNPISKTIAKNAAKNYIEENYKNRDFVIEEIRYNFKDSGYNAYIKSPSSVDTHFSVYISMSGEIYRDSYESVINGWNTYQRIDKEYDVKELAKTAGNIVYYAEDEEVSFEKAAVSLLKLKEFFD